jgi:hypothetical protein
VSRVTEILVCVDPSDEGNLQELSFWLNEEPAEGVGGHLGSRSVISESRDGRSAKFALAGVLVPG